MSEATKIDPQHASTRRLLRILGPILAGIGLLLIVVGMLDIYSAYASFELPHYFWCLVFGIPVLLVGMEICQFAFRGG